ncbi:MAG: C_GCAxxG_C_C family protein [Chloroflexia bacterium]|nr:C_GCAxxG_C_C family protein [Chloroflexia bacterium]
MVKDYVQEALHLFENGFNCSQAVLCAFCEDFNLPKETALRITCPFGGGIGGCGKTCGALTGAIMVIGLKYGSFQAADVEAKKIASDKTKMLIETFEGAHGSCNCNDLIGFNRSSLSDKELMGKKQFFLNTCPKFIETVVAFLEEEI